MINLFRCTSTLFCLALALLVAHRSSAAVHELVLTVSAGEHARSTTPVKCDFELPESFRGKPLSVSLSSETTSTTIGQITQPSLSFSESSDRKDGFWCELHFLLTELKAGETLRFSATVSSEGPSNTDDAYLWKDAVGKYSELSYAGRPILRYMYEALDDSSAERRGETHKVYHHVYDPHGNRFVTKGPGGKYPHHRGLFYGFSRISYGNGKSANNWVCNRGEVQSHQGLLRSEVGKFLGRHLVAVDWHGRDGDVFVKERREITSYYLPGGTLIEFASELRSNVGKVRLDGDPQHAGFQFRSSQEVADQTGKQTYYLRPDGRDKPGSFRNWSKNARRPADINHANLPWNAMCFVLGETRYTCCYLDHPRNPKEARYSERDYGRFGSYFEYDLDTDNPLRINYRIWLQEGEMTVDEVSRHSNDFVDPPIVRVSQS